MASSLVAVDKSYLKALVQSAKMNSFAAQTEGTPPDLDTVTIARSQYDQLMRISQQFENLKISLLKGGVRQESLDVLINEPTSSAAGAQTALNETEDQEHARGNDSFSHNHFNSKAPSGTKSRVPAEFRRDWRSSAHNEPIEDEDDFFFDEKEDDSQATGSAASGKASRPVEQRTIEIRGLPERAIHRDVTDAIRGGAILELYLRYHDRSARVSFIEPSAAQEFLNRAKRHDIYIMGKRVEVSWSDRQFYLRPYIKQNIDHGASRNLVIRRVHPNVTATLIRDHLEHIHNLVVVDIKYNQGNAFIATNSVHNAMFARSCMMSRTTYRGMRIEFSPDECAQPPPRVEKTSKVEPKLAGKATTSLPNRFQMLSVDGAEDSNESEDDDDDDDAGARVVPNYQAIGSGSLGYKGPGIAV